MSNQTQKKLATLLNHCIPTYRGLDVVWKGDAIFPARGIWRQKRMDVQSWSAYCYHGGKPWGMFGCWESMTECIKAGKVELCKDGETIAPVYRRPT